MSLTNADSNYSRIESEDFDVCSLPKYSLEGEDGDLQVNPSKSDGSLDGLTYACDVIADDDI